MGGESVNWSSPRRAWTRDFTPLYRNSTRGHSRSLSLTPSQVLQRGHSAGLHTAELYTLAPFAFVHTSTHNHHSRNGRNPDAGWDIRPRASSCQRELVGELAKFGEMRRRLFCVTQAVHPCAPLVTLLEAHVVLCWRRGNDGRPRSRSDGNDMR